MEHLFLVFMGIWLSLCSLQDMRRKEVHIVLLLIGIVIGLAGSIVWMDILIQTRILGAALGGLILGINLITKGQIGVADGIIVGIIGVTLGFYTCSGILLLALFLSAVVSFLLILLKKVKRNTTIPFVPFLLAGFVGVLVFT